MKYWTRVSGLVLMCLLALGGCDEPVSEFDAPNIIFANGKIITMARS